MFDKFRGLLRENRDGSFKSEEKIEEKNIGEELIESEEKTVVENKIMMPAVALRGLCVMPGMVIHFDLSKDESAKSVDLAMAKNQKIFLNL